ncbi:MAG: DUF2191 domain-containing protein [Alphaproteobacteria bacterium]|nr:DUF2191 domain-containing protein [Alphaproteobacteria bacterium]MCY3754374.1 DUF2191 domain-containing protein [Alphaproteobacteria bacterium]
MPLNIDLPLKQAYSGAMKTTGDILDRELEGAIRFTKAKTKQEAVGRRIRMAELALYAGTCSDLTTPEELRALRRQG